MMAEMIMLGQRLAFFLRKSTEMSESISASIDYLMPTEETELFISLLTEEPKAELIMDPSFSIFITLAFSPFFRFAKLESPDLALETLREELKLSDTAPKFLILTAGEPLMVRLTSISISLSYFSISFWRAEVTETLSLRAYIYLI
jgi:hypothetical protein